MAMATRLSSSAVIRSTAAAHISLTVTSLAYSAFGPSRLQNDIKNHNDKNDQDITNTHHKSCSLDQEIMGALPWLDQLHKIIANMYCTGSGTKLRAMQENVMVQMHSDASLENPLLVYSGVAEIERAFRARLFLYPQNDVQTLLECVHVEASDESISNGGRTTSQIINKKGGLLSSPTTLISYPSPIISPPTIKVAYRLQQKYGKHFTVNSLLVVTIQVRRGTKEGKVHNLTPPNKMAVPLATSGCYGKAAVATTTAAVTAVTTTQPVFTTVLSNALDKISALNSMSRENNSKNKDLSPGGSHHPLLVAEVVRIEEMWRGVPLIHFFPFHCSRRLNGAMMGLVSVIFN